MTITYFMKKLVAIFLTAFYMLGAVSASPEKYETKNPEEVLLDFSVISDCHIESNNFDTFKAFIKILRDVKKAEDSEATVFLGDNTMNGQNIENMLFYGGLSYVRPEGDILVATGNHDLSNSKGEYSTFRERFIGYNNAFLGNGLTEPYFYKVIDGYYFIVLSSEKATVYSMYMSETQYEWLEAVLEEAEKSGKPIFVFNHYPVNYLESDSDRLSEILNDYENLLYFCGHSHLYLCENTTRTYNGVNCINIPKTTETVDYDCGIGARVEVYEDEILVRFRDFHDNFWREDYEYSYPIK